METIRKWFSKKTKKEKKEKKEKEPFPFLKQPVEIILQELSYLPPHELEEMSRTSQEVRTIIRRHKNLFCKLRLIYFGFTIQKKDGCCALLNELDIVGSKNAYRSNWNKKNLLITCSALGKERSVRFLLGQHDVDVNWRSGEALRVSARSGHTAIVRLLLQHGARVNINDALTLLHANSDIEKLLLQYGDWENANIRIKNLVLRRSVWINDVATAKRVLQHGANVNDDNGIALRKSITRKNVAMVKLLLQYHANVHLLDDYTLHIARHHGPSEIAHLLLQHGAN